MINTMNTRGNVFREEMCMNKIEIKPRILVVGSINIDFVIKTPRIPLPGENIFGEDFRRIFGGKGANQAVGVAQLGCEVVLSGRVGEDQFGNSVLKSLREKGVDTTYVERDSEASTGIAFILIDKNGENSIVIAPGANGRFSLQSAAQLRKIMKTVDLVLLQLELPLDSVAKVIEIACGLDKQVVLDAGPPCKRVYPSFFNVTVLTPNKAEAEALSGQSIRNLNASRKVARGLLSKGPQAVVLKLGEKGAVLTTANEEHYFPAYQVNVVDTTAAGDAFSAALSVAIAKGQTFKEAVEFANAAGALATTKVGAQPSLPTQHEVETFLSSR